MGKWKIGQNYFIRTATYHVIGRLEEVTEHELWLSNAAWVADSGLFHVALRDGTLSEVEAAPDGLVAVGRSMLIDAYEWHHPLVRESR